MAITPVELETLSLAQQSALERARDIIDEELRLKYNGVWPIKIRRGIIDFLFEENQIVIDALLAEYGLAGWYIVKYSSEDQGDWYQFTPV